MRILLFILLFAAISRAYKRLFLPRPAPGQEGVRVGFVNWFLILATTIVSWNFLASGWHAARQTVRVHAERHHGHEFVALDAPDPKPTDDLDALIGSYRDEIADVEAEIAAAKSSGVSYERAEADPALAATIDRLVLLRRRLVELESDRDSHRPR